MGLFDFLKGKPKPAREPPRFYVARDDEGDPIFSDDIVSEILKELEDRRADRSGYELQWTLNADFLAGNQNMEIDPNTNSIVKEAVAEVGEEEHRVYNRIAPLMDTRLANLMKVKYDMFVKARTGEMEDQAKAKIGTKLLEYCQSKTGFDTKIAQLLQWSEICGTAFTISYWDKNDGDIIAEMSVSADDGMIESSTIPVRMGDIAFGLLSPYEVFPASLTIQNIEDQHDIITEQIFDSDTVQSTWGIKVEGENIDTYCMSPDPAAITGHGHRNTAFGVRKVQKENAVRVVTYYEKPDLKRQNGRMIVIVKDKIVFYGDLPGGVMPIVAFKSREVPGLFFGRSPVESLIPLQRSYNEIQNKIMDYVHVTVNAPLMTPAGSLDMDVIEQQGGIHSGDIVEYSPERGEPHHIDYPPFPPLLTAQRDQLAQDMEYTAGVSQLMVYGTSAASASGAALDTRRDIDMTRMSLTADNIRGGVIAMARIWLILNKTYSIGYRTVLVAGSDDMAGIYTWCADDINSYDVEFRAENELRRSEQQQKEDFLAAYQLGLFTDDRGIVPRDIKRRAWELFNAGDMEALTDIDDQQRKNARYEIVQYQMGIIPPDDIYADDAIHLEEHLRFALSNDYRIMKQRMPNWAALIDRHIAEHRQKIEMKRQEEQRQMMAMQMAGQGARQ